MPYDHRDPDAQLVATFHLRGFENNGKSIKAGRPIYDDIEICEIRVPGSREVKVFPATEFSHWGDDPLTGRQVKVTYAERFRRQYQQFKEHAQQTKSGTPLTHAPFLTDGRRAELRAMNIYTVEQLAAIEGAELKNLGPNGREFKNKAAEFLADAERGAPSSQLMAELEAAKARAAVLEDDNLALKAMLPPAKADGVDTVNEQARDYRSFKAEEKEDKFIDMTSEQLREYIRVHTGSGVTGNPAHKTLVRMAMDARPDQNNSRVA
jgi:hypothetical protein